MEEDIRPITGKLEHIDVQRLCVQYIPYLTPENIWLNNMNLSTSPHVELMQIFKIRGIAWATIVESRYWAERIRREKIGIKRWSEKYLKDHIRKRYNIFDNFRIRGWEKYRSKEDPIKVLIKPFWETRFGCSVPNKGGMEIWNGAGRCSAAFVLGIETLPVMMCEDAFPGSNKKGKFESKLKELPKVWEQTFQSSSPSTTMSDILESASSLA